MLLTTHFAEFVVEFGGMFAKCQAILNGWSRGKASYGARRGRKHAERRYGRREMAAAKGQPLESCRCGAAAGLDEAE